MGVGRASAGKLRAIGVNTAADLRGLDARVARQLLTVTGERLVREMNGVLFEITPPGRKGIAVTRSFGAPITQLADMLEATAFYATRAGEKLRRHGRLAHQMQVFFHTSRFADGPSRSVSGVATMLEPTSDTLELVRAASGATRRLWQPGYRYAKAGIIMENLVTPAQAPRSLLALADPRRDALMTAMDAVNSRFGRGALSSAQSGVSRAWTVRADMRSPAYTTRLSETPIAAAGYERLIFRASASSADTAETRTSLQRRFRIPLPMSASAVAEVYRRCARTGTWWPAGNTTSRWEGGWKVRLQKRGGMQKLRLSIQTSRSANVRLHEP